MDDDDKEEEWETRVFLQGDTYCVRFERTKRGEASNILFISLSLTPHLNLHMSSQACLQHRRRSGTVSRPLTLLR